MNRKLRFALLIVCSLAYGRVAAQYVSSGPNGGAVYSFYKDNGRIYAGGSGGVYTSSDDGVSWQASSGSPSAFGCDPIYSVAASGPDIYAGSFQNGIYHSGDGGNTWQGSTNGLRLGPGGAYADIEIAGPNVLAVRPDSGFLFLSTNQGINWQRVNQMLPGVPFVQYLSIYNNTFYVSTPQGLFTTANGLVYNLINPSPADFGRLTWATDTVYAATTSGVKMSLNGGISFSTVALPGRAVRYVAVAGSAMYAVVRGLGPLQDTVLYSSNGGTSFNAAPLSASFQFTTVNDLIATSTGALAATDYGLFATRNGGSTWVRADSGYHATTVRGLAVSGRYVLAGASPLGVFRAVPDSGTLAWQHTGNRGAGVDGNINAVAARGAFVHAGGTLNYYRSTDSGATWTAGAVGVSSGNITSLYASLASSDVFMVRNGNLFLSSNDGTSFGQVVNSNIPAGQSLYVTKIDTAIFVAAGGFLYKGGSTMSFSATTGITGRVMSMARTADSTIWAATDGFGLYTSKSGATWTSVSAGPQLTKANALVADGDTLYAGTDNGVYARTSGTWTLAGLQDNVVLSLAVRAGRLFAGTCSGVFSIPYKVIVPPGTTAVGGKYLASGGMEVFPNPASSDFTVRIYSSNGATAKLVLRNMLGATVLRQSIALKAGMNEMHIPARDAGLAPGVYLIQITGDGLRANGRVVLR